MSQTAEYSIDDLIYLMSRLRDPESGCPWDLKQDFNSIVAHTLEEAYEVADAIEQKNYDHLEGELGDLLFQVIFYSQLGREQQRFDFESVVSRLVTKLIRRHPHVFPDGDLKAFADPSELSDKKIKETWEKIKAEERTESKDFGVLADIPNALPALSRAVKLQKRASQVGFDWDNAVDVLDKIEEEIAEVREALETGNQQQVMDEMGDLIFAQVNLARHLNVNPEAALRGCNDKFRRRFEYIEENVSASGRDWPEHSLTQLDALWDKAKEKGL